MKKQNIVIQVKEGNHVTFYCQCWSKYEGMAAKIVAEVCKLADLEQGGDIKAFIEGTQTSVQFAHDQVLVSFTRE